MDHNNRDPSSLHAKDNSRVPSADQTFISVDNNVEDEFSKSSTVNVALDTERLNHDINNKLMPPFQAVNTARPMRSQSMSEYSMAYNNMSGQQSLHTIPTQSLPTISSTGFALANSKSANSFAPFIAANGMHLSNGGTSSTFYGSNIIGGPPLLSGMNMRADAATFTEYYRFPNPSLLSMGGSSSLSDAARDHSSSTGSAEMAKYSNNVPAYYPAHNHHFHPHMTAYSSTNSNSDIFLSNGFQGGEEQSKQPSHGPVIQSMGYPPGTYQPVKINPMMSNNGPFFANSMQRSYSSSDVQEYRPALTAASATGNEPSSTKGRTSKKAASKKDSSIRAAPKMKEEQSSQHPSSKEARANNNQPDCSYNGLQQVDKLSYAQGRHDLEKTYVLSTDDGSYYAPLYDSSSIAMNGETIQAPKAQKPRTSGGNRNPKQPSARNGSKAKASKNAETTVAIETATETEKRSAAVFQHDSQPTGTKTSNKRSKKSSVGGGGVPEQERDRGGGPRGEGKAGGAEKETKKKEGSGSSKRDSKARADSIANSNSEVSFAAVRSSGQGDKDTSGQDLTAAAAAAPVATEQHTSAAALTRRRDALRKRLSSISTVTFIPNNNICASFLPLLDALPIHEDQRVVHNSLQQQQQQQQQARYVVEGRIKAHRDYLIEEVQWLALDFRQELRWKLSASKSVAEAICTTDSSCQQKMVMERLQTITTNFTSKEITAEDKSTAKMAASVLSASVSMLWNGWEVNILGSTERSVVLNSLFQCSDRVLDPFPVDDRSTMEPVDTMEYSKISSLENEIDRVLSIPLLLHDDGTFKSDNVPNGGDVTNNLPNHPSIPSATMLQEHQQGVLRKVQSLNRLGFGAGVYGKSYVGKTVAMCFLIREWLTQSDHASVNPDRRADDMMIETKKKIVILVAARKCIFRWISELRRLQSMFSAVLWSSRFNASQHKFATSTLMVIPLESLVVFLASNFLSNLMLNEDSTPSTPTLNGILVDVRCCHDDTMNHSVYPSVLNSKMDSFQSDLIIKLTSQLSASFTNRCILSELSFLNDSHLQVLHFMMPKTSFSQWTHKYMPQNQSDEDHLSSSAHPINRNTLVQLLFNLSIHLEAPACMESMINDKILEGVIHATMDSVQLKTYNCIVGQIEQSPSSLDGADAEKLAKALVLLSRACFHGSLLSVCSDSFEATAARNGCERENIKEEQSSSRGGMAVDDEKRRVRNKMDRNIYLDDHPSSNYSNDFDVSTGGGGVDRTGRFCSFAMGPLGRSCVLDRLQTSSSAFNEYYKLYGVEKKIVGYSVFGSGKLTILMQQLSLFNRSKIVIVVQNIEELKLVHLLLSRLRVSHVQAGFRRSKHQDEVQRFTEWLNAQRAVECFNMTTASHRVLLCTKEIFEAPSLVPERAAVVIVLSESWIDRIAVKECFRMRLLSARYDGSPLEVIRVVAERSIEVDMADRGCSFLHLQGITLPNLCVESALLMKAPPLKSPTSTSTINGKIVTTSDLSHETSFEATYPPTPTSVDAHDHSDSEVVVAAAAVITTPQQHSIKRGRGKGIIALCRQGGTSFVKDSRTLQELGLIGARPSILLAINHMKIGASMDSNASDWVSSLRSHMYALEERLCSVNEFVQIDCSSTDPEGKIDHASSKSKIPSEKKTRSGHHYFLTNPSVNDDKKDEEGGLEGGHASSSYGTIDKREAPRDKSIEAQVNDPVIATSSPSSDSEGRAMKGRIKLLDALNTAFLEAYNNFLVNNSTGRYSGGSAHVSIIQHLHCKWKAIIDGLDDSSLIHMIIDSNSSSFQYDSDSVNLNGGLSSIRRGAGTGTILGKSTAETQLAQLFLPFPDRVTMPLSSSSSSYTIKAEQQEGFQQWPKSYHLYRYIPSLLQRAGIAVQPSLSVNPLQAAGRFDYITSESYQAATADSANIHFNPTMSNPKSTTATAPTTTTATVRGSKPRRPRPTNNKSNNNNSSTAKASEGSADKLNPAYGDMDATDASIPLRKKAAHLDKEGTTSSSSSSSNVGSSSSSSSNQGAATKSTSDGRMK